MADYKVTIKNNEETIVLSGVGNGEKGITSVVYKMNTLDDMTRNRADAVRLEFTICGEIIESNKEHTQKLAKWAMDTNRKTLYRDVEIEIYAGDQGELLRTYKTNNMFVIDYQESFLSVKEGGESDKGIFELFIAQKEGSEIKEVYAI